MNKKAITPIPQHPVDRISTGKLPSALAELTEAALLVSHTLPAGKAYNYHGKGCYCAYDADEE